MSRAYSMAVEVTEYNADKKEEIIAALNNNWDFDAIGEHPATANLKAVLYASGEDNLTGGESETEFANRLAKDVWAANGAYCYIEVAATFLELRPFEVYILDENYYKDTMETANDN